MSEEARAATAILVRLSRAGVSDDAIVHALHADADPAGLLEAADRLDEAPTEGLLRWRWSALLRAAATGEAVGEPPAALVEQDRLSRELAALPTAEAFTVIRTYSPTLHRLEEEIRTGTLVVDPPMGPVLRWVQRRTTTGDKREELRTLAVEAALYRRILPAARAIRGVDAQLAVRVSLLHLADLAGVDLSPDLRASLERGPDLPPPG